jgi:hypothetical protein
MMAMSQPFASSASQPVTYDSDFHAWLLEQAGKLRLLKGRNDIDIDIDNIVEELEGLARRDLRALKSAYEELLFQLLKWVFQPELRNPECLENLAASWSISILKQRNKIAALLTDSPSLKAREEDILRQAYAQARERAEIKARKKRFPAECPWTLEQVTDKRFPAGLLPEE